MRKVALLLTVAGAVWMASVSVGQPTPEAKERSAAIGSLRDVAMLVARAGQRDYAPKIMNIAGRGEMRTFTNADAAALKDIAAELKNKADSLKPNEPAKAAMLTAAIETIIHSADVLMPATPTSTTATAATDSAPAPAVTPVTPTPVTTPSTPAVAAPVAPPAAIVPPTATPTADPVVAPVAASAAPAKDMTFRLIYGVAQPRTGAPLGPPRPMMGPPGAPGGMPPRSIAPPTPAGPPQKQLLINLEGASFLLAALTAHLDKNLDKASPTAAVLVPSGEITFAELQSVVTALARYNFVSIRIENLPLRQAPPPASAAPVSTPAGAGIAAPPASPAATPAPSPSPATARPSSPVAPTARPANPDNQPAWSTSAPDTGRILRRLRF